MAMRALFEWRCRRAERLLALRDRRRLEADLASFTTHAELVDLRCLLDRLDDAQTSEVREILGAVPARR